MTGRELLYLLVETGVQGHPCEESDRRVCLQKDPAACSGDHHRRESAWPMPSCCHWSDLGRHFQTASFGEDNPALDALASCNRNIFCLASPGHYPGRVGGLSIDDAQKKIAWASHVAGLESDSTGHILVYV